MHEIQHQNGEAITNSPEIDAQVHRWREVRPGMFLGVIDFLLSSPVSYKGRTFPAICLSIVLEGYATNTTEALESGFHPDEVWISSTGGAWGRFPHFCMSGKDAASNKPQLLIGRVTDRRRIGLPHILSWLPRLSSTSQDSHDRSSIPLKDMTFRLENT